jgi:TPR repeat protein
MAAWYLADAYYDGKTTEVNLIKSKEMFDIAEKNGLISASYMLGRINLKLGLVREAFLDFHRGSEKGYLPATYRVALAYRVGEGVDQNINKYKDLIMELAMQGHVFAMRDLSLMKMKGEMGISQIPSGVILYFGIIWSIIKGLFKPSSEFDEKVLA